MRSGAKPGVGTVQQGLAPGWPDTAGKGPVRVRVGDGVVPGRTVGVLVAVAPDGDVGVAVAPGCGVLVAPGCGVLVGSGCAVLVAVGPPLGRVGVGVSVGTVWKSGDWSGNAQAPGMMASMPKANRPAATQARDRDHLKRLSGERLLEVGIDYCPIAGRCSAVRVGCHKG